MFKGDRSIHRSTNVENEIGALTPNRDKDKEEEVFNLHNFGSM